MKILVAYDGSPHADAAIDDLRHAGFAHENEVLVISVANHGWPPSPHPTADEGQFGNSWKATMKEAEGFAEHARQRIQSLFPAWKVSSEPLWGDPAKITLKTIDHWKPDVLVVGSHGRGAAARLILGSVSLELVHHAPCSVRITRLTNGEFVNSTRILIAIDGSAQSEAAVHEVARRGWPTETEVQVLAIHQTLVPTVGELVPSLEGRTFATDPAFQAISEADDRERDRLQTAVDTAAFLIDRAGLKVNAEIIVGNIRHDILAAAKRWHAGTIFVGARGLGAVDRLLLGSTSDAVVTHAHCTVEVIRQAPASSQRLPS